MNRAILAAIVMSCGCATLTRARTETAAKTVATETIATKSTAAVDTAKRVHRVTTRTRKPSGEVITTTVTDIGVDVKAASSTTAGATRTAAAESTGKSDVATKTRGWKWFAGWCAAVAALALAAWFVGRRLVRLYL